MPPIAKIRCGGSTPPDQPRIALAPKVEGLGFKVRIPHWREQVTLD